MSRLYRKSCFFQLWYLAKLGPKIGPRTPIFYNFVHFWIMSVLKQPPPKLKSAIQQQYKDNSRQYNTLACNSIQSNKTPYIPYNTTSIPMPIPKPYNIIQCNTMQYNAIQYNACRSCCCAYEVSTPRLCIYKSTVFFVAAGESCCCCCCCCWFAFCKWKGILSCCLPAEQFTHVRARAKKMYAFCVVHVKVCEQMHNCIKFMQKGV